MKRARVLLTVLLAVIIVAISGTEVNAASANAKIKNHNYPTTLVQGTSYNVKGTISANKKIKRVEIGIVKASTNKWTSYKYDNKKVNAKSFNIKKASKKLKFNKLAPGKYYYRIYVHFKGDKKVKVLLNKAFTVKDKTKITTSGINLPSAITKGQNFSVKGKISATNKINRVEIGIVNRSSNTWTSYKYDNDKVGSTSFDISKAACSLNFSKLAVGNYSYRIYAHVPEGVRIVVDQPFTVKAATTDSAASSTNASGAVPTVTQGTITVSGVTLKNYNKPTKIKFGESFNIKGMIESAKEIKRVEVGIVFEDSNKWTPYVYDASVNAKTFDLSVADPKIYFGKLCGGTFYYRIYVHTEDGVVVLLNEKFTVTSVSPQQDAVAWAKMIANDDSFTYGEKPKTNKVGCYFCGTNKKNKPEGFEKTYVCMTFVNAAYAHGAHDPEMLKICQGGRTTIATTDENFKYSCWTKVGLCKDLSMSDLKLGDVLVYYDETNGSKGGHTCIYGGGDTIIEATSAYGGVWEPKSITIRSGAAKRLARYATTSKSYVMRYNKG
jgi:uncharacterized protein (DUF2141 family)